MKPVDCIWTEKYRPTKVSEVVGSVKLKILKHMESPSTMPHFLFYSTSPGTGKSSMVRAIINELGCDSLMINSSDDRTIEVVREKIREFAMTQSSKPGLRRIIFLDEFDGMMKAGQDALRTIMEVYAKNVIFLICCNNLHKINEPIKSRCVVVGFAHPEKEEIFKYLERICYEEELPYSEDGLKLLIDVNYPSIRNCVLALQDFKTEGLNVTVDNVKPIDFLFMQMWNSLTAKDWVGIKQKVLSSTIDARDLNTFFWNKALEDTPVNIKLIQICCRNEKDIAWGADAKIVFVTSLVEMIK